MDTVAIEGLVLETVIGVHPWERTAPRNITLDVDMAFDCAPAGISDDLADALDYAAVAAAMREEAQVGHFELLEALADAIASRIQADFNVPWLRLSIRKPGALTQAANVRVTIERGTRPR